MDNNAATARADGYASALAVADWAGLLGVAASAADGLEPAELARLGGAIQRDGVASARAFNAAGDLDRADAMQLASDIGGLLTRVAPGVDRLIARDLDALAMLIADAAAKARQPGALAVAA